jgi:hypothetical protein
MAVNVCPADQVQAPVELVWELLMHPAGYGRFLDLTVERVEPDGPAAAGQRFAEDGEEVVSAVVPNADDSITTGVY